MRPAVWTMKRAIRAEAKAEAKSGRAQTPEDRLTRLQRVTINALAGRWLKLNVNALCAESYRCRPTDLSREAADEFIGQLKQMRPSLSSAGVAQ